MSVGEKWWMGAAVISIVGLWLLYRFANQKSWNSLARFASAHLLSQLTANVSLTKRRIKQILTMMGIALCLLSLARPQWGFRWEETKRKGVDLLFAVDTSKSMLAPDVNPHRLARAKLAVLDLLEKLPGDRVGLIAFSGSAFLQCPLTLDYDAFRRSVEALDTNIIPKGGTNIAAAIQEAEAAFRLGSPTHKILILITDGEDLQAGGIISAQKAAENGVKVFTVGVGTSAGDLIPLANAPGEFLKDDKGAVVKSRLDETTLRQIADVTSGLYQPLGQRGEGLEWIYQHGLAALPKQELSSRMARIPLERFQWPLGIAIGLLIFEFLMSDRRRLEDRGTRKFLFWKSKGLTLLLVFATCSVFASPQSAERAYQKKDFNKAFQEYKTAAEKNSKKAELHFNAGSSAYRLNKFDDAAAAFQRALQTDNIPVQQQSFYNLGNTQYRIGQQTEKTDVSHTIQTWQQALKSYESALSLKSDDADAKYNYEFVKKKLEELQKKEEEKKKQEEEKKQEEKDKKDQEQKDEENKDGKKDQQDPKDKQQQEAKNQEQKKPQPPESKKEEGKQDPKGMGNDGKDKAKPEEPRPLPGQMTQEEAKSLLDSLKDDEKKMPVAVESGQQGVEDTPAKDW
jgi:Ca-activated chloride channel homolog